MNSERFVKLLQSEYKLTEETLSSLKQITEDYPWFQTGWMLYLLNLKKLNHPDFEPVLKQVAIMVPDRKRLYKFLNNELKFPKETAFPTISVSDYQMADNPGGKSNSLIDKFLSTNPGLIRNTHQNENIPNKADGEDIIGKSIIENDDLITETLANLYLQQKNYDKALEAFKKLSLKYPEKNIYFASRIKEIEVIKNNN